MKKEVAGLISALVLLALASFSAYSQGLAGCCCDLQTGSAQSASFLEYTDCLIDYNFILPNAMDFALERDCTQICAVRAEGAAEVEEPEIVPSRCGEVGYTPAPKRLDADNVKGEKQISLQWEVECPADYFIVTRCYSGTCTILSDQVAANSYVDDSDNLLWNEDYEYHVTAHYNLQGDSEDNTTTINTGDIECWNRYDSSKFCISRLYYRQFEEYFTTYGYGEISAQAFSDNFTDSMDEQFFDKYKIAYSCGSDNKIVNPDNVCERKNMPEGICVADAGGVDCVLPSECENIETGGLFGLFYAQQACEGTADNKNFCYLDKSRSIIDKCYSCREDMGCYDYRSRGTCERDNCGVGDCAWKDVYQSIGVGVCVDTRFSNCYLCDLTPSEGSSEAFNEVFEQCSLEKSEALSTDEYPCYWSSWKSFSCDSVSCNAYRTPAECASPSGGIRLHPNNTILVGSNDPCEIRVCQWRAETSECLKNADGDTGLWPDCTTAADEEACELDFVAPETDIVATGALGVYDKLNINIFDKISRTDPGEYKTGSKAAGYTTYFCHYPEGQPECNIHLSPYTTSASSMPAGYLTLHNTELMAGQSNITKLAPGFNFIKYYTKDPSNNPGIVKQVRVYACSSCVGPQIIDYNLENGVERAGNLYTNSVRPALTAAFDVNAEITTAEVDDENGFFVSQLSYTSTNGKNFTFTAEQALDEGRYEFRINAKDNEGTFMNSEFVLPFIVDLSAGMINFTVDGRAAEGARINKSKANVAVEFEEPVTSVEIQMNGRNITGMFTSSDNKKFSASNIDLDEGVLLLSATARDFAENGISGSARFHVNGKPPIIKLKEPTYGVTPIPKFDIVAETLNEVDCRFLYDVQVPMNFSFGDLEQFDETGETLHTINEFVRIKAGDISKHTLHVFCVDPLWGMANASFEISLDEMPPEITSATADPNIIKEEITAGSFRTKLKVKTDEITFCKYSPDESNYERMQEEFPDYKAIPPLTWPNTHDIAKKLHNQHVFVTDPNVSYTYYAACEDLAGHVSDTKSISFTINLGIGFNVESRTQRYWNKTSVDISVETNKRAYCYYGANNQSIENSFQEDGEYIHKTYLSNLPLGKHTIYVRCNTRYLAQEVSNILPVVFNVDTTPPQMVYVNDTGPIPNDPQFSYSSSSLRANWLAEDNESPVTLYNYTIETFYAKAKIINWTLTTFPNPLPITGLNLQDDTTYRFVVKPFNAAGLWGEIMESDGVTVDFEKMPDFCNDTIFAGIPNETDLDCGGVCPPCGQGLMCLIDSDCSSGFCEIPAGINATTGTCRGPACDDGRQNGDETGLDCGGSCPTPCALGALCMADSDCETGNCMNGICSEPDPCSNDILDGTETDIDCGGSCSTCSNGATCISSADCSSGLCIQGTCEPKRGDGEACMNDTECISGYICKNEVCREKKKLEGESCALTSECDEGLMCHNGMCVKDTDGDGMPDSWEITYNLDPNNPADALFDPDEDTLTNFDEFKRGTDPTTEDTDGDVWTDSEELDLGTDPLDSASKPSMWKGLFYHPIAYWWLWLLLIALTAGSVAGGIFGYKKIQEIQKKKEEEKKRAAAPKPGARKAEEEEKKARELTPAEKKALEEEAEEDRKIAERIERLKEMIKKKQEAPKEIPQEDWVDIRKIIEDLKKRRPKTEVKPVFEELSKLKKGKLGIRGRKKALEELEKLLGKKAREAREEAEEKEKEAEPKARPSKKDIFERLAKLGKTVEEKAKEIVEESKEEKARHPITKLRMMAFEGMPLKERRKVLEKFMLLKTGKLKGDERKELFDRLKITAAYYKKHKKEIEEELRGHAKKGKR